MYKFIITHLLPSENDKKWCLDFPRADDNYELHILQDQGVYFQGWALFTSDILPEPFIRAADKSHYFTLNMPRADVVSKVLKEAPEEHKQLRCGFHFTLPLISNSVVFGFRIDQREYDYATLMVEGGLKVLEGKAGWLFLDNDANHSVDQYRGKQLLSAAILRHWSLYLDSFYTEIKDRKIRHALLIAPAKEMILSEYYPFEKGTTTPIEQLLDTALKKHAICYPDSVFKHAKERPFRICDTHWTPYGAMLAAVEVLRELGIDTESARVLFAQDQYKECEVVGDLGNKIYPPRSAKELVLTSFGYRRTVVYDNQLANFGRVMLLANSDALHQGKCLLFGSSSSYTMLDYFSRLFTEIVFVHSAGNIDISLLAFEQPDYVVAQTNARFVIVAPTTGYDVRSIIHEKLAGMPETEKAETINKSAQWLSKSDNEQTGYYHALLTTQA